jgi:glycosyltransferase involved in cell wall biosynthesis
VQPPPSTLWIDLTDLEHWTGTLTGIQRTTVEYIVRFQGRYGERVRGFVFRARPDRFVPATFVYRNGVITVTVEGEQPVAAGTPAPPTFVQRVRGKLRSLALRVPGARRVGRKLRSARHSSESVLHGPATERAPFVAGDRVMVLGGNWPTPGYADFLAAVRDGVAIHLAHVVYDLVPIRYPQWAPPGGASVMAPYMDVVLPAADAIITISEATARDVTAYARDVGITLRPGTVPVAVRLGANPPDDVAVATPPTDVDPAAPFVLTVGTTEIRKNHGVLYQVWALAAERGIALPPLYLAGSEGWMAEATIHMLTHDPEVAPNVRVLGSVSDAELRWLYRNARIVVYPSFAEGWGLPIGEAASYGKLCITSPHSSMPEVAGDYADYVSPYDPAALLAQIQRYLDDDVLAEREAEIRAGFKVRTWDESFEDLVAVLDIPLA